LASTENTERFPDDNGVYGDKSKLNVWIGLLTSIDVSSGRRYKGAAYVQILSTGGVMKISATVINQGRQHRTALRTNDKEQSLTIPAKVEGLGSSVNGGELLFLAIATCYCNDIYREANERGLKVESVEVEVTGHFGAKGEPAENISYRALVKANGTREEVLALMRYTDSVAEIHNTLRRSTPVKLVECQILAAGQEEGGPASIS